MKQRDWVKELEEKRKKKKVERVIKYDKNGWFKWYYSGSASSGSGNDVIYYTDTGTGNVF